MTVDYADLAQRMTGAAARFTELGVRRGDRVAVYLDKRVETVLSILAASCVGAVFVPINPVLKPRQAAYIIDDCDAVLPSPRSSAGPPSWRRPRTRPRCARWSSSMWRRARATRPADRGGVVGSPGPRGREPGVRGAEDRRRRRRDLYTSGSTGMPKGVVLSHRNIIVGAESVSEYLENTSEDVILAALPLSFDAGFSQLTTAFAVGAHVVLVNYLLPKDVVRLCERHGVTGLTAVPPLWVQLTAVPWPVGAASALRYFANTGGRLSASTLGQLRSRLPAGSPFPHVRPHRGVPLDLPRPCRGRPSPGLDRQGDPERRGPRRPPGRDRLRRRRAGRARAPRTLGLAGLLERPRSHRRAVQAGTGAAFGAAQPCTGRVVR